MDTRGGGRGGGARPRPYPCHRSRVCLWRRRVGYVQQYLGLPITLQYSAVGFAEELCEGSQRVLISHWWIMSPSNQSHAPECTGHLSIKIWQRALRRKTQCQRGTHRARA